MHLLLITTESVKKLTAQKKLEFYPDLLDVVRYIDLRVWGADWFDRLDLPDLFRVRYVFRCIVTQVNKKRRDYTISIPELKTSYRIHSWFVYINLHELLPNQICVDDLGVLVLRNITCTIPSLR